MIKIIGEGAKRRILVSCDRVVKQKMKQVTFVSAILTFVNDRYHCRFYEEDKVVIMEIQLIPTLTLNQTLIQTKIEETK